MPTIEAYEDLALTVELATQQLLQAHNYNTVGNFVRYSMIEMKCKFSFNILIFQKLKHGFYSECSK